MSSIRRMLLVALLGLMSLLMALAAGFSYHAGLQEAGEMFDARLVQSARVLLSLVDEQLNDLERHPPGEPIVIHGWHGHATGVGEALAFKNGHAYETKLAFQVMDAQGRILLRSDSAPDRAIAPLQAGYADVTAEGATWRTFTLHSPAGFWYQSSERSDIRAELARDIAFGTLLPLLLALPVLGLAVWWVVNLATRSLLRVSDEIGERDPERLAPLNPGKTPREVHGLVRAVNGLLERLEAGISRERRFIADAAHELRTPISALKVHVDNLRSATDDEERADSQRRVDEGVARVERMVAQLLALSRVDHGAALPERTKLSLDALALDQIEDAQSLAGARGQRFGVQVAPVTVLGDEAALAVLVRNLLENAVRYTPAGGAIRLSVEEGGGVARLCVEDSGPGIAPEARERVFERFHRELGSGVEGSGLGLAIVREVLDAHGGTISLDQSAELGGLRVIVQLPAITGGDRVE